MKGGWLATVAGSGILLSLIAVFAIRTEHQSTRIYSELSASDAAIQTVQIELSGLRSDIFLSGIYIRNQLLNSRSAWAEDQRDSLRAVRLSMDQRLQRITSVVPNDQEDKINDLRQEIEHYWKVLSPMADDPAGAAANGPSVREQLRFRRDAALEITEQIGAINQATYGERHSQIEEAQVEFRNYIWAMMAVTLGMGLLVFAGSAYLVAILTRRSETHRERVERTETELRSLSSDLFRTQEQERRLLSRELHDEVGQTLTALGMEIGNVERLRSGDIAEFQGHIDEAKRLTQETLKTVRKLAMGLRPAMLDDSGLVPAVRYLAREFSRHSRIPASVEISGVLEDLPEAYRTCVYRVVQEALTNCARHSGARNVQIRLDGNEGSVTVVVADDGHGFRYPAGSGMGLIGMNERARELNGKIEIVSGEYPGTVLRVELPTPTKAMR